MHVSHLEQLNTDAWSWLLSSVSHVLARVIYTRCACIRAHERNLTICVHGIEKPITTKMNVNQSGFIILSSSSMWCNLRRFRSELKGKTNALLFLVFFSLSLSHFYIQLSTVDHYGNEYSYFIITLRHEQWQSIYNRLSVIKSFSSRLIIAKHIHLYTNAYTLLNRLYSLELFRIEAIITAVTITIDEQKSFKSH